MSLIPNKILCSSRTVCNHIFRGQQQCRENSLGTNEQLVFGLPNFANRNRSGTASSTSQMVTSTYCTFSSCIIPFFSPPFPCTQGFLGFPRVHGISCQLSMPVMFSAPAIHIAQLVHLHLVARPLDIEVFFRFLYRAFSTPSKAIQFQTSPSVFSLVWLNIDTNYRFKDSCV